MHDAALKYGKYYGNAGEQYLSGYTVSADTRMVQNGPACDGWRPAGRGGRGRGTGPEEEPVIGLTPGTAPKPAAATPPAARHFRRPLVMLAVDGRVPGRRKVGHWNRFLVR